MQLTLVALVPFFLAANALVIPRAANPDVGEKPNFGPSGDPARPFRTATSPEDGINGFVVNQQACAAQKASCLGDPAGNPTLCEDQLHACVASTPQLIDAMGSAIPPGDAFRKRPDNLNDDTGLINNNPNPKKA